MVRRLVPLLLRRHRTLLLAAQAVVGVVLVWLLAFNAVAFAMALAPNSLGVRGETSRVVLPGRTLHERAVRVGPQPATLAVATLEPESTPARGTVVLLHGIRMDRRSLSGLASSLSEAGYRAVLLDLRGHGASTGRYLTYGQQEAHDVQQVLDALERELRLGPVAVLGFSYGAAVALDVAALDPRVKTAIAIAPFSSLREVVRDYQTKYLHGPLKWLPDAWFQAALDDAGRISCFDPDRAGPEARIARGSAPLLLMHGDADRQVELRHSKRLESLAGARAKLLVVPGATHDDIVSRSLVRDETLAWLASRL